MRCLVGSDRGHGQPKYSTPKRWRHAAHRKTPLESIYFLYAFNLHVLLHTSSPQKDPHSIPALTFSWLPKDSLANMAAANQPGRKTGGPGTRTMGSLCHCCLHHQRHVFPLLGPCVSCYLETDGFGASHTCSKQGCGLAIPVQTGKTGCRFSDYQIAKYRLQKVLIPVFGTRSLFLMMRE